MTAFIKHADRRETQPQPSYKINIAAGNSINSTVLEMWGKKANTEMEDT